MSDAARKLRLATEEPYELEAQVGFRLRRAHQRATEHFNAVMGAFGVTPTQFSVLARLSEVGEASQNQLGRLTAMDPATILGVVNRLRRRDWIVQRPDPADGRAVLLSLSPEGEDAAAGMMRDAAEVSRRTLAPLNAQDARRLLDLLDRIS